MPNANYVCTICSQTFTRRWRGKTHNDNLHSGSAKIVRFVDYIMGRLNGQYFPGDPSLYRSKNRNVLSHETNNSVFGPKRVLKTNDEKSATGEGPLNRIAEAIREFPQSQPVTQPRIRQNGELNRKDTLDKTAKLKTILDRHGSPGDVQRIMKQVTSYCMTMGDCTPLDMALDEITKWGHSRN